MILKCLLYLFYVPEQDRTCETGFHEWGEFEDIPERLNYECYTQKRYCRNCGRMEVRAIRKW